MSLVIEEFPGEVAVADAAGWALAGEEGAELPAVEEDQRDDWP